MFERTLLEMKTAKALVGACDELVVAAKALGDASKFDEAFRAINAASEANAAASLMSDSVAGRIWFRLMDWAHGK